MKTNRLRVWAPHANKVEIQLAGGTHTMERRDGGWWEIVTPLAIHGADYAFKIDDGPPLPDPRSPRQPEGVHGPSQIVDHRTFVWTDKSWQPPPLSSAIIYELHVGTFSPEGTFDGVANRLDHLVDLGITHVELMPVNGFSGSRGWGYDGVNLFAPHEVYGASEGMKRMVDACHQRGIAVILDVVYNHLGPEGNYLEQYGPYFTECHASPWGKAINFDSEYSDEVRRFFCDNALMWLRDYHVDALRIDAVHAIVDMSATHILEQIANEVATLEVELGKHKYLIAESDLNDPRIIRSQAIGGYGIDAQWSDDFHHALHTVLTGERSGYYADFGSLSDLADTLTGAFAYAGKHSPYRKRSHGRSPSGLSGHKFLGYIQNHDQVGNRARGDRISQLVSVERQKVAAALVMTAPFIPMIFQGEEWGASTPFQYFTDHQDRQLGDAVREGRRGEFISFGWSKEEIPDPQAVATFERSRLRWDEIQQLPHSSMLQWYRQLIQLRKEHSSLMDGRLDRVAVQFDIGASWLMMHRGEIGVAANLSPSEQTLLLLDSTADSHILLASDERIRITGRSVWLPAEAIAILLLG